MTAAPQPATQVVTVQVRYFAGARAAAGVPEETVRLSRPATVADALAAALAARDDGKLARVVEACSFLLDGLAVHDRGAAIEADTTLDVLPPFAGG
ncbi:MoaD/ThiS family protein [Saccharopolyspora griseoalba]|uniref:MoaD/ThiS family protein n=1 Tax=Saccharopolyspora griseoalba TaxID=1431848 RepID=A0ABW2LHT1_9PSEU